MTSSVPEIPPLPVEEVPPGETDAIQKMIDILKDQLRRRYQTGVVRRDAHPKHLGLVHAHFIVEKHIPEALRYGVFREPERKFKAKIRFSNGHPTVNHDLVFDIRGCAIKLLEVRGSKGERPFLQDAAHGDTAQDFLTPTGEAFFGIDAVEFVDFPAASEGGILKTTWYFFRRFPRRLRGGWQLLMAQTCPRSPLDAYYFSQAPYRLGPHCVKYHVRRLTPRRVKNDPVYRFFGIRHLLAFVVTPIARWFIKWAPKLPGYDVLREALIRDLGNEPVTLEFLVQRWPDLSRMPVWAIEDATRRWDAPWERVATIEIPRQHDIPSHDAEAERIDFNPWRVLPEHQPLGSVNRARLAIYSEMSRFRKEQTSARQHGQKASSPPADPVAEVVGA